MQGAHFSRDIVNRPGFAKLFFESASEEREHAIKLIEYLLMRGELTRELDNLIVDTVSMRNLPLHFISYFMLMSNLFLSSIPRSCNGRTELKLSEML